MTARLLLRAGLAALLLSLSSLFSLPVLATTTDATPELRNSPKLATPERVKTDPFSGTAAYAYPIDLPPGTAGMTPQLVLTYSTQTQHSEYGYGWSLNLPYIERSTREHRPYYNDPSSASPLDDEFELAGDLLVREGSASRFHLRYADGSRILWDASNSRWEVTKPDGTRQLFGSTQYSRIFRNEDTPAETFRWSLSEVIDPRGNSYRIFYRNDADVAGVGSALVIPYNTYVYPLRITYTHALQEGGSLQDHRTVEFEWEERANLGDYADPQCDGLGCPHRNLVCDGKEDCPTAYRAGFKVQRRWRLSRIAVGIDTSTDGLEPSEEVRSYTFDYTDKSSQQNPLNPPFSQLAAIQRFGKDGALFPSATEFTYTRPQQRGFENTDEEGGEWADTPGMISSGQKLYHGEDWHDRNLVDMNGDGVMDRVEVVGTSSQHEWLVYLGRIVEGPEGLAPAGFDLANPIHWSFDCGAPGSPSVGPMCAEALSEHLQYRVTGQQKSEIMDMDGDLLPDRVVAGWQSFVVYRNEGTGFGPGETWSAPIGSSGPTHVTESYLLYGAALPNVFRLPADLNGDGRPEYLQQLRFLVNTGSGFGEEKWAWMDNGEVNSSWPPSYTVTPQFNTTNAGIAGQSSQLLDVNSDGIADYVPFRVCFTRTDWAHFGLGFAEGDAAWQQYHDDQLHTSVGHEHVPPPAPCPDYDDPDAFMFPESRDSAYFVFTSLLDLNGDGIRDWVWAPGGGVWIVYFGLGDGRFLTTAATGGPSTGPTVDGIDWDMSNVTPCDAVIAFLASRNLAVDWFGGSVGRTIDLDGDGLVDYVRSKVDPSVPEVPIGTCEALPGNWSVWRHPGPEGLLETVTNELGGTTKLEYTPSTWLKSLSEVPESGDPPSDIVQDGRPRWVVTKVEVKDGRAGTAMESERLDYAGFRFDQLRRETFGVRMAENEDAEGLVTRSLFHQHPKKRGKLERQEKCQGASCFERIETEWSVIGEPVPDQSFLVRPTKTTTRICDGTPAVACDASADAQVRVVAREFDEVTGLLTRETDYGPDADLDANADNLVRVLHYAKNTADWIVSTIFEESLYFGSEANLVSRTRLYYDAAVAGGGTPTTPQRCMGGSGLCGALVTFRETLRDLSPTESVATEKWVYDDFGNMEQYFDPKAIAGSGGATQTVVYDGEYHSFPVSISNALGHTSQFRFDAGFGEVEKVLTPGGHLRCSDYDEFGRLASRTEQPYAVDSEYFENASCNADVASFRFLNLGDPESQRIEETLASGTVAGPIESLRYFDGLGREYQNETRHRHSPPSFDVVSRAWGTRGELSCETLPFRRTGNLEDSAITSCLAQTPRRETRYDALLRPLEIERVEPGGGRVTEVLSAYAINGDLTSSVGDLWVEQRTTIGGPGAANQGPTPDRVQLFGLDNRGQVVMLRDGADPAATTTLVRDPKGRITRVDGPDVTITSGGGVDANLLEIAYNAVDQRTQVAQPISAGNELAPAWRFTYDLNGDLYEQTSPRNQTIRFHHDALRRLALKDYGPSYSSSPAAPGPGDIVHDYYTGGTGIGQLANVYGRHGIRTDFGYDWRGRVASKTRDYWGSMQFAFGYSYDALDRPLVTYLPDTSWISHSYDGAQLTELTSAVPLLGTDVSVAGLDTHPSGGLSGFLVYSPVFAQPEVASSYGYGQGDHRLESATTILDPFGTPQWLQDLAYSYDTAGNLRQSDDDADELDQDFAYDALHRLAEVATGGSAGYGTHRYVYDLAGNLTHKGPPGASGDLELHYDRTPGQPTHVAAADLRLSSGQWLPGAGTYTADADGGITSRTHFGLFTTSFTRNADGRIQGVGLPTPDDSAVYHYDPSGERSEKLLLGPYAAVLADRYYVDPSFEVDTVGNTHEVHVFVGGRRIATSERTGLGNTPSGSVTSVTTYHPDQVGTNTLTTTTTASGQTVSKSFLDPFGMKQSGTGTEPRHLFTDQERDAETGLDYFGARFYDPWVGRFLEEDPQLIGIAGVTSDQAARDAPMVMFDQGFLEQDPAMLGDGDGSTFSQIEEDAGNLNPFAYVLNRPTGLIDPNGEEVAGVPPDLSAGSQFLQSANNHLAAATMPQPPSVNSPQLPPRIQIAAEHTKDARKSTEGKHAKGEARKGKDQGGSKASKSGAKRPPRKPPEGWPKAGKWPPSRNQWQKWLKGGRGTQLDLIIIIPQMIPIEQREKLFPSDNST